MITNIDEMTTEDRKEYDYLVNVLEYSSREARFMMNLKRGNPGGDIINAAPGTRWKQVDADIVADIVNMQPCLDSVVSGQLRATTEGEAVISALPAA